MTFEWEHAELSGYLHFSKQGYRILVSLVRNEGYDFVIEKNGRYKRVNVKKAYKKHQTPGSAWAILYNPGLRKRAKEMQPADFLKFLKKRCDIYLIWLPDHNKFIETTPDFLLFSRGNNARIPPELIGDPNEQPQYRSRYLFEQRTLAKDGLKRCNLCKKIKPLTDFCKGRSHGRSIVGSYCKPCWSLYTSKSPKARAKLNKPGTSKPYHA